MMLGLQFETGTSWAEIAKNDLRQILIDYLGSTSYISQVAIDYLPTIEVNQALFCTAIDNLIRNGLKYNDSDTKWIKIYKEDKYICIEIYEFISKYKIILHISQETIDAVKNVILEKFKGSTGLTAAERIAILAD